MGGVKRRRTLITPLLNLLKLTSLFGRPLPLIVWVGGEWTGDGRQRTQTELE